MAFGPTGSQIAKLVLALAAMLSFAAVRAGPAASAPVDAASAGASAPAGGASQPKDKANALNVGGVIPPAPAASSVPTLKVVSVRAADDAASQVKGTGSADILRGAGDIVITLTTESAALERAYTASTKSQPHLFVNGINLGDDGRLVAVAPGVAEGVPYHFYLQSGKASQDLWAYLYRVGGLTDANPVTISLGWNAQQAGLEGESSLRIAISSARETFWAFALAAVVVVLLCYVGGWTDALRDAPVPSYISDALALLRLLKKKTDEDKDQALAARFADKYDKTKRQDYSDALKAYQTGTSPSDAQAELNLTLGIALARGFATRSVKRATFSLSRTQLAVWFTFALCAGLFLFVAKGDLPPLDGSLLILLGISVGTASAGQLISADGDGKFRPSRNFIFDLVTGPDDKQQVHRLQAVAVNLLLVVVGFVHIKQQLTYPIFDNTWLYFLGISGTAYAAGKQLTETSK